MGRCAEFVLLREFRFVPHGSSPQFPLRLQVWSSGLLSAVPGSVDTGGSVVNLLSPGAVSVVVGGFTVAVVAAVCFPGLATIRRFLAGSPSPLSLCVPVVFKLPDVRPSAELEDLRFVVPPSIDPSVSDEPTGTCFFFLHVSSSSSCGNVKLCSTYSTTSCIKGRFAGSHCNILAAMTFGGSSFPPGNRFG